jgi:hypothetical protein
VDPTPETVGGIIGGALLVIGAVAKVAHKLGARQAKEPPAPPQPSPADATGDFPAVGANGRFHGWTREELEVELDRLPMTAKEVGAAVSQAVEPVSQAANEARDEAKAAKNEVAQLRESLPCKPDEGDPDNCPAAEVRQLKEVRR